MAMTREEKLNYIASHYMQAMWRKAYSVLSDGYEAEDACQEAFIKLIKIIDGIEDVTEPRVCALCGVIAKNTAIDMARKNGRAAPTEDIYLELDGKEDTAETPEQFAESAEQSELIVNEIRALPEVFREVLELRCIYEFSAERTAELLSTNANTVNIRLSRARKLLRERLEKAGVKT